MRRRARDDNYLLGSDELRGHKTWLAEGRWAAAVVIGRGIIGMTSARHDDEQERLPVCQVVGRMLTEKVGGKL